MKKIRCAIYTRKSSEEGLDQDFNSLDAQREACEAYILSQKHEGWKLLPQHYDDGGVSGGTMNRPALKQLLADVDDGIIDQIVVYKIDRLTRSLADFAKLVEKLDAKEASFVSVTQSFNTSTSMGRLTLNVLLSFAQFEREVTAERIRDKITASKKKGMWMGGTVPLGYKADGRTLAVDKNEAEIIKTIYRLYLQHGSLAAVKEQATKLNLRTRERAGLEGKPKGDKPFDTSHLHHILTNPIYCGKIKHKNQIYDGLHEAIIEPSIWDQVQQKLSLKAPYQRGTSIRATSPSPLLGKVFDETGDRLVPSHANKKGKRYRYYISSRLIKRKKDNSTPGGWRLPAATLEKTIAEAIIQHLTSLSPTELLKLNKQAAAQPIEIDNIQLIKDKIGQLSKSEQNELDAESTSNMLKLLQKAHISKGNLKGQIDPQAIADLLQIPQTQLNNEAFQFQLPFTYRKRGVETKIIWTKPNAENGTSPSTVNSSKTETGDETLINNLAKAQAWYQLITEGKSFTEIANTAGTSKNRIQKLIQLAFLAPDIKEEILKNRQPISLTSEWLLRQTLPSDFEAQRKLIQSLR